jgi:hypothetical protein
MPLLRPRSDEFQSGIDTTTATLAELDEILGH